MPCRKMELENEVAVVLLVGKRLCAQVWNGCELLCIRLKPDFAVTRRLLN